MNDVPTLAAQGATIPKLGFGTWQITGEDCVDAVKHALATGYRHIDTAQAYENEPEVGEAIEQSDVPREEIFLTTKIWMANMAAGDLERSARRSVEKLKVDRVDLLLLHWPNPDHPLEEMIAALNAVRAEGLTRHIGVSNYTVDLLDQAVAISDAPLVTNQVEYHPFIDQGPVLDAVRRHGMALTAYSPIAQGGVNKSDVIADIAKVHGKSAIQVSLRWLVQQDDVVAIPRSGKPEHIESNFDVFDFELTDEEMARIAALGSDDGRLIDPSWAPDWDRAA
ncbi:aldo/keto reductase [Marinicauda salina]|uniref:Aldo/keto reductase n=1 Tax=Marinicauda salina TaxID=2135793 RepID=A0A2U2BR94_9PROT|nr:aldo/keto reductase [Marinicauda salina]PWE16509.1 aldo/keto reductase [Marinicauda salina]